MQVYANWLLLKLRKNFWRDLYQSKLHPQTNFCALSMRQSVHSVQVPSNGRPEDKCVFSIKRGGVQRVENVLSWDRQLVDRRCGGERFWCLFLKTERKRVRWRWKGGFNLTLHFFFAMDYLLLKVRHILCMSLWLCW